VNHYIAPIFSRGSMS